MLYAPFQFFVSSGTSYATTIYCGLCRGRFRPETAGSEHPDERKRGLRIKEVRGQVEGLEIRS